MKLVDTNVLLYAIDSSTRHHEPSRSWLTTSLVGAEPVAFAWVAMVGFLRISTHPAAFARPLDVGGAVAILESWLAQPAAVSVEPRADHLPRLRSLLQPTGSGGNLVNDAHLAALAIHHDATVVTYDNDFDRFPAVRWERPSG